MTSMISSVKSPWMIISSSAVTEAPQENVWAKNRWASLRSMSAREEEPFRLRIKCWKGEFNLVKHWLPNVARPQTRVTYFFLDLGIFAIVTFCGTVFFFCLIWPLPPKTNVNIHNSEREYHSSHLYKRGEQNIMLDIKHWWKCKLCINSFQCITGIKA